MSNLTLEAVENKIAAIIEDPQGNYTVGGTHFTWTEYYSFLRNLRRDLIETQANNNASTADIGIITFDVDINEFGEDNGQRMR